MSEGYLKQVELLVRCLPEIAKQDCFALKGGTAINLFFREMPRLSVDIDLAYLPLKSRDDSLSEISSGLQAVAVEIRNRIQGAAVQEIAAKGFKTKLVVHREDVGIKIEPNLVFRGSVYPRVERSLVDSARNRLEADVAVTSLSEADLYGGKLCAALDRQHPRDLFDVWMLWNTTGLTNEIRQAFVVYLAGHPRPVHEVLDPRLKPIEHAYETQFEGMAVHPVPIRDLMKVQQGLAEKVRCALSEDEKMFLLSIQKGEPAWDRLPISHLQRLPAVQWKLLNVDRMTTKKRKEAVTRLEDVLRRE